MLGIITNREVIDVAHVEAPIVEVVVSVVVRGVTGCQLEASVVDVGVGLAVAGMVEIVALMMMLHLVVICVTS